MPYFLLICITAWLCLSPSFDQTTALSNQQVVIQSDEPTFEELIGQLNSEEYWEYGAFFELSHFDFESEHQLNIAKQKLESLLNGDDYLKRVAAAELLYQYGHKPARLISVATTSLNEGNAETRSQALQLLSTIGFESRVAIDSIVEAAKDDSSQVRLRVAWCLGNLGPDLKEKSVPPLLELIKDSDDQVSLAAAHALFEVDGPVDSAIRVMIDASSSLELGDLGKDAQPAIGQLLKWLKPNHGIMKRCEAAEALGEIGVASPEVIAGLSAALRDGKTHGFPFGHHTWCVSDYAAKALARLGEPAAIELLKALQDENQRVRANAAFELGYIPDPSDATILKLIQCLSDPSPTVRASATWSLGQIGNSASAAIPELVDLLFDDSDWSSAPAGGGIATSFSVAKHAVDAILKIRPDAEQLMEVIQEKVENESTLNFETARVIESYSAEAIGLTDALRGLLTEQESQIAAAYALAAIYSNHPVDKELRLDLQQIFESRLIQSSREADEDEDHPALDQVAARGLFLLKTPRAIPTLKKALEVAESNEFVGASSDMIFVSMAILNADENSTVSFNKLLTASEHAHWYFDKTAIQFANEELPKLLARNDRLSNDYLNANKLTDLIENSVFISGSDFRNRLFATRIILRSGTQKKWGVANVNLLCRLARDGQKAEVMQLVNILRKCNRETALTICSFLDDEEIYSTGSFFVQSKSDRNFTLRQRAIETLIALGPDCTQFVQPQLTSDNHLFRSAAVIVLGNVHRKDDTFFVEQLVPLINDPSHRVRQAVVQAISELDIHLVRKNKSIQKALETAANDHRKAVSSAARAILQSVASGN